MGLEMASSQSPAVNPRADALSEAKGVIFASSLGTVFEWYDFYIYATLAPFCAALFFPSGLTLYMFTNNVLSALHSIYMNKFDKRSLAAAAKLKNNQELAAQAAAAAAKPGGAAGQAANPAKKNGAPVAKRVIDAKATAAPGAAGEESDDAPEGVASPGAGAARNRPRRKKRRR